ncbi:DUF4345 family protein [Halioglobus pacificus]|uniref:DUF4345 domain-containing protein n=1 Tax=Parahalioglobus pacificus TaxID=930806 RepID=A0A918XHU8_9GAMM|nr:DUF4345 family protein [Halioglobus pacificus]GHD31358.1 hypothetical protein GCM10007053_14310 [Halioglobus pacificus]
MIGKFILWLSAIVFTAYGLFGFFNPEIPAGFAGIVMSNGNAFAEIGAMYGGLQTGIGLFCAVAALKPEHTRSGLLVLLLGIGFLALGRLYSALTVGEALTAYTWGALVFEVFVTVLAGLGLKQSQAPTTP